MQYMTKREAGLVRERKSAVVDRELDKIHRSKKLINPRIVLDAAREESHPLHRYFDWDDKSAGEKYRLEQARAMIMASKFVVFLKERDEAKPEQANTAVVRRLIPAFKGEGFRMRNEVLQDQDTRAAVVAKKKEALRSWCRSVVDIEELSDLRAEIEKRL